MTTLTQTRTTRNSQRAGAIPGLPYNPRREDDPSASVSTFGRSPRESNIFINLGPGRYTHAHPFPTNSRGSYYGRRIRQIRAPQDQHPPSPPLPSSLTELPPDHEDDDLYETPEPADGPPGNGNPPGPPGPNGDPDPDPGNDDPDDPGDDDGGNPPPPVPQPNVPRINPRDQFFADALLSISENLRNQAPSQKPEKVKVREPDTFDGSDPRKLRDFLVQCNLHFRDRPETFASNEKRILFILSYLKGPAMSWFEPGLMDQADDAHWMWDFEAFV